MSLTHRHGPLRFVLTSVAGLLIVLAGLCAGFVGLCVVTPAAHAQSWQADWQRIYDLYYLRAEHEQAFALLASTLDKRGNDFSSDILDEMLPMLKEYYSIVDQKSQFRNTIISILRIGREDRIVEYFSDAGDLYTQVQLALATWKRPQSVVVTLAASDGLVEGDSTTVSLLARNARGQTVPTSGIRLTIEPATIATVAADSRMLKCRVAGTAEVVARDADGRELGRREFVVTERPRPSSATIALSASAVDVGGNVDLFLKFLDADANEIAGDEVPTLSAEPDGIVEIDARTLRVTAVAAGTVTISALGEDGVVLGSTTLQLLPAIQVTIVPESETFQVGEKRTFRLSANRSLDEFDVDYTLTPEGLLSRSDISVDDNTRDITITAERAGRVFLRAVDARGTILAESLIDIPTPQLVAEAPAPSKRNTLIAGGIAVGLGIAALVVKGQADDKFDEWEECRQTTGDPCTELGDEYDSKVTQANILGVSALVATGATGYFGYRYYQARKSYHQSMAMVPITDRTSLVFSRTRLGIQLRL